MEWVSLHGYEKDVDLDDKPRKLSKEEIDYITAHVPYAPSADSTSAEIAREGVTQWIRNVLNDVKLAPSAIPELIEKILEQHYNSLAVPGTPVGITAAEAVGATTTQMTLNSVAPHERIFFQDKTGVGHLVKIGEWIDSLLEVNSEKIVLIPENRTQYLELDDPVFISTPDKSGKVSWDKVTAVTKHLPVGDLVKITTFSKREVTVTKSKSLLTYNGLELIQEEGKNVKIGTLVPILFQIPTPEKVVTFVEIDETRIFFTPDFGILIGAYLASGEIKNDNIIFDKSFNVKDWCVCNAIVGSSNVITSRSLSGFFAKWLGKDKTKQIPTEILLSSDEMIRSVLDGFFSISGVVMEEYDYISFWCKTDNRNIIQDIAFLCSRFGIFGIYSENSYIVDGEDAVRYATAIGSSKCSQLGQMKNLLGRKRKNIVLGNIILDPVVSIESVPATEFVYDLTVPTTTNFSIFSGLGVADTFHTSGSSKSVSFGIDAIRDIIYARKNLKNEGCTIYFKDTTMTFEEVLNTRIYIVGSVVADFVKDYDIDRAENLSKFWWHDKSQLLFDKDVTEQKVTLRLFIDIDQMYKHRVTIKDLAETLQREIPSSIIAIYGPISDGIIDLYPSTQISETDFFDDISRTAFFENVVVPDLKNIRVKGISGIKELAPMTSPIWRIVLLERMIAEDDIENSEDSEELQKAFDNKTGWLLFYNTAIMRSTGITKQHLVKLCTLAGITVIGDAGIYLAVSSSREPSEIVVTEVNKEKKQRNEEIQRLGDERIKKAQTLPEKQRRELTRKPIIILRTPLMEAAEFVYAETIGSNLKDVLGLPDIDKTRTTCNNMYTIASTLGIEAARTYAIKALTDIIANASSYVHPTNITLIAEFITSRGEPHGATYGGISRQPGGHLSLASLERAGQVFTQNALTARKEDIRNVSASVAVGTRMAIGDGFFDIGQDVTIDGVKKIIVNDDLFTDFALDDVYKQYPQQSEEDMTDALNMLKSFRVGEGFTLVGGEMGGSENEGVGSEHPEREDDINLIAMFDQEETQEKAAAQIKTGVPVKDKLETLKPMQMVSRGLIEAPNIIPSKIEIDMKQLQNKLNKINVNPPRKLASPTGKNLYRMMTDLRREQVGELK